MKLCVALAALLACAYARTAQRPQTISAQITSLSDKDARQKASVHPAFANAGRQAGIEIWRIENFNPVPVAQKDYGQFYKGDSYIILKTTADKRNNLSWDIYYWIGSESTQDESGAAAILTVGLDDKFNGAAVQHREPMGYESPQFTGLFRPAIRYLDGGVASGFHHVTTNPGAEKRLFQVKGKRNVRVRQDRRSGTEFSELFLTACGRVKAASRTTLGGWVKSLLRAGDVCASAGSTRRAAASLNWLDNCSIDEVMAKATSCEMQCDEQTLEASVARWLPPPLSGDQRNRNFVLDDVLWVDPLISSMNKGDCFILDVGNDVYVYVGEKAKNVEKLKATSIANQIRDQDHNGRARVETIDVYSSETDYDKFFNALGSGSKNLVPEESAGGDDQTFERNEEQSAILNEVSDSSGKVKVTPLSKPYRQEQLKPQEAYILDTVSGSIYVWMGRQATEREKSEAMAKAQQYKSSKNYPAWVQVVRIPQGTEPAIFKQYFTTWRDVGMSHSRLVRSIDDDASTGSQKTREIPHDDLVSHLYKVDMGNDNTVIFEEVPDFKQSDLDADKVYVVEHSDEFFVWLGSDAPDMMRKSSQTIINAFRSFRQHMGPSLVVKQHLEPLRFTVAFGVFEPYGMKYNDGTGDQSKEEALNDNQV